MKLVRFKQQDSFNRLGVFWRVSEESVGNPSLIFSGPLFCMFDTLRSKNPIQNKIGETWFRTYIKNYSNVLMPLLSILSLASVERGVVCVDDDDPISASIPVSVNFILPNFNSGQVLYVFETLESLLGIGEGLFLDPLWSSIVNFPVPWLSADYNIPDSTEGHSYALLLVFLCVR